MNKVVETVMGLAGPIAEQYGCELWDVEYVSEGGQWYLRVYIDKDGGVGLGDCEAISRALDPVLDEKDPVAGSYIFEVSSPGAERALKRPSHFERFLGESVEVKLYRPLNGTKVFTGALLAYENGDITLVVDGNEMRFAKDQLAKVRLKSF